MKKKNKKLANFFNQIAEGLDKNPNMKSLSNSLKAIAKKELKKQDRSYYRGRQNS